MRYTLLIDKNEDILNIQEMGLRYFYGGQILTSRDSQGALEILKKEGCPEIIIMDIKILDENESALYQHFIDLDFRCPLIACSAFIDNETLRKKFPAITSVIEKPFKVEALTSLVKSITIAPMEAPTHVPVKLTILIDFGIKSFDLFIRLSGSNFVKVINQGEVFTPADSEKFSEKGIEALYIKASDCLDFLAVYASVLNQLTADSEVMSDVSISLAMDSLEGVELISKRLGWNREVIDSAERTVNTAINVLSRNIKVKQLLRDRLSAKSSPYSRHIGLQAFLCCAISGSLASQTESNQMKLAMASLIHDMFVPDEYYSDINNWNKKASNPKDKSPEVIKYRLHPFEASKSIQDLNDISNDVDLIILQHHERKDGSGFPRALNATRISYLSALFIIVEEFIDFILNGSNMDASIADFITWGDNHYDEAAFGKIYKVLRVKLMA